MMPSREVMLSRVFKKLGTKMLGTKMLGTKMLKVVKKCKQT